MALPDASNLRLLELASRHHGSGLTSPELFGEWRVERIWPKGSLQPSPIAGGALRALTASLRMAPSAEGDLSLTNSIALGPLKLWFSGPGHLKPRRPLLIFHFLQLRLSLAGVTLLTLALPKPTVGREPFFALIARGEDSSGLHWLAARGRGGGLALWVREENGAP